MVFAVSVSATSRTSCARLRRGLSSASASFALQQSTKTLNRDENNLVISVTDYGKGIPEDIQEKLFKEMVTTKGKNGTGLGLFMSYSNIRAHFNGNMRFESEVGKGTTFEIILPV